MKTKEKKNKLKFQKRYLLISIVLLLACMFLFLSIRDKRRHQAITQSMDRLQQVLTEQGFRSIERKAGCGRTQVKYGPGAKVCSDTITTSVIVDDVQEANPILKRFSQGIDQSSRFVAEQPFSERVVDQNSGIGVGYAKFKNIDTNTACFGSSIYSSDNGNSVRFSLRCDDTSWFAKTFQNGRFFF